jgi:fructose-1,6-bisphosphatase/inositol monophosphatase family enzyme
MREAVSGRSCRAISTLAAHEIDAKAADDVVTIADHEAEAILARAGPAARSGDSSARKPPMPIPALLDRLGDALCWIVDPLDGTNNFAAGKPPFGVLVALAEAGETIAGLDLDPLTGRLCHAAIAAAGAFIGEERVTARASGSVRRSPRFRWSSWTRTSAKR